MSLALFIKNSFLHSAMCRRSHHWRSWLQTWFVLAGGEPNHKACALIASNDGQCWGFEYLHLNMFPLYRFECSMWRWTLESIVPKCFSYHWYRLWVGAKLLGQLCCTIHIFNTIFERSRKLGFEIAGVGRSHFSAHPRFSESDPARGDLCEAFWRVWVSENYFFNLFPKVRSVTCWSPVFLKLRMQPCFCIGWDVLSVPFSCWANSLSGPHENKPTSLVSISNGTNWRLGEGLQFR